jgi:AcrR family transcriptional regulator
MLQDNIEANDRSLYRLEVHARSLCVKEGELRKGDETKARVLDHAVQLASIRGLSGLTLGDLADDVGLSKSGLFKHFVSKEDLQRQVLEEALQRFGETVWRPVDHLPNGRPKLEAVFDRWLAWVDSGCARGGCVLVAASIELDDQPGPLRDMLKDRQARLRQRLIDQFLALRAPPLTRAEAEQAVFEMRSFVFGYSDAFRLLEDSRCRAQARRAFAALLDRLTD